MNNPYQNPYMGYQQNPYQMQVNPYMDRLNNLQQFQQSLHQPQTQQIQQPNYLLGKMVESIDVVKATDIPMDGNLYYFPKADNTEIYAKCWMPNGTTRTLTFKPVLDSDVDVSSQNAEKLKSGQYNDIVEAFMKRFDELEKRLDSMTNPMTKSTGSRNKKDGDSE